METLRQVVQYRRNKDKACRVKQAFLLLVLTMLTNTGTRIDADVTPRRIAKARSYEEHGS